MNTSGSTWLFEKVRSYFAANGVAAEVRLGWRETARQDNQERSTGAARVVFTPGAPNGAGGVLTGARNKQGYNPRSLYTWEKKLTVSIWAIDPNAPESEHAQIQATEDLFEWVVRAVQASAAADAHWGSVTWTVAPLERVFGKELVAELTHSGPLFDTETATVVPTLAPLNRRLNP